MDWPQLSSMEKLDSCCLPKLIGMFGLVCFDLHGYKLIMVTVSCLLNRKQVLCYNFEPTNCLT